MQRKHGTEHLTIKKKKPFFPVSKILPLMFSLLNFMDVSLSLLCAPIVEKQVHKKIMVTATFLLKV